MNLSIFHRGRVVNHAKVPSHFFDTLSCRKWHLASVSKPLPARTSFLLGPKTHHFALSRVVKLLGNPTSFVRLSEQFKREPGLFLAELEKLPKITFRDSDPFNCMLENLEEQISSNSRLFVPKAHPFSSPTIEANDSWATEIESLETEPSLEPNDKLASTPNESVIDKESEKVLSDLIDMFGIKEI